MWQQIARSGRLNPVAGSRFWRQRIIIPIDNYRSFQTTVYHATRRDRDHQGVNVFKRDLSRELKLYWQWKQIIGYWEDLSERSNRRLLDGFFCRACNVSVVEIVASKKTFAPRCAIRPRVEVVDYQSRWMCARMASFDMPLSSDHRISDHTAGE